MLVKGQSAATRVAAQSRQHIPTSLLQVSGRALYSPASTLVSGSPFYFLGFNPREVPDATQLHSKTTVEADLKRLEQGSIAEHGYLDEKWKNFEPGYAPIQVRGQMIFALLAGDTLDGGRNLLRITPTSNFILQRSPDVKSLEQRAGKKAWQLALAYWPFHQAVIHESRCTTVVTHAIGIARQLARHFGLGEGFHRDSGWGGTLSKCYAWQLPEGPMLLAIPNLSRYIPNGSRQSALSAFFKEFIRGDNSNTRPCEIPTVGIIRPSATLQKNAPAPKLKTQEGHLCRQLVESARYLEFQGMSRQQLSQLHHFDTVSFADTYRYFGIEKELRGKNIHYAERVKFVAKEYKRTGESFTNLIHEALKKWPL